MEVEDRESTDSGSLSGNPDSDSPPLSGGTYVGLGGGVVPGAISVEKSAPVMTSPAVGVGGGVIGGGAAAGGAAAAVLSGGAAVAGGGGNGDLTMGKKKRGRPRKYDADGNLNPAYIKSPTAMQAAGFTLSTPPSLDYSSGPKKGRGKHSGSGNWKILASLGELFVNTAGGDFTPHVVTVHTGEDVAGKILTFAQKGHRGICVLSANGSVSNVTLRQPGSSGGLLTYEGRFEILTLTGSYTVSDNGGMKSRTGGLSVTLASPDGRVIGGGVAGLLMAANPIQIVVGSFVPNGFKAQKKKQHSAAVQCPPATVTAATPLSQAPPETSIYPTPVSQLFGQSQGEADNSLSNKELPNSASTDTGDWNGSGPGSDHRHYPDINISVSVEEH